MIRVLGFGVSALAVSAVIAGNVWAHDHGGNIVTEQALEQHHLQMPKGHDQKEGIILGGIINGQYAYRNQDHEDDGEYQRNSLFRQDTEVHVHVNQRADNGLRYGAVIELEADQTAADDEEGVNADKTYLYLQSQFGRAELGNNADAGHMLSADPSSFAVATGGIHGDAEKYFHLPERSGGGHSHIPLIHSPSLPVAHNHGVAEDASKISYFTPVLHGAQAGFSFTPDTGNGGTAAAFSTNTDHDDFENVVNGALYYSDVLGDVTLRTSLAGEVGGAEAVRHKDLAAYQASVNATWQGVTVGGSYGNWGQSGLHGGLADETQFFALGTAYDMGAVKMSVTYLDSERDNNTFNQLSVGAEYQLAPGLTPYIEYSAFEADASDVTIDDNSGGVLIIGTQLAF